MTRHTDMASIAQSAAASTKDTGRTIRGTGQERNPGRTALLSKEIMSLTKNAATANFFTATAIRMWASLKRARRKERE